MVPLTFPVHFLHSSLTVPETQQFGKDVLEQLPGMLGWSASTMALYHRVELQPSTHANLSKPTSSQGRGQLWLVASLRLTHVQFCPGLCCRLSQSVSVQLKVGFLKMPFCELNVCICEMTTIIISTYAKY